jgi:hypothetical protein
MPKVFHYYYHQYYYCHHHYHHYYHCHHYHGYCIAADRAATSNRHDDILLCDNA